MTSVTGVARGTNTSPIKRHIPTGEFVTISPFLNHLICFFILWTMNSCQAWIEQAYNPHTVGRWRKGGSQGQPWYAAS